MSGTTLSGANLSGAGMSGTIISLANLTNAKYGQNILTAQWNEHTIFSKGQKGKPDL
jgi:uncharacterized protein YjbI with pentapeptide repeats